MIEFKEGDTAILNENYSSYKKGYEFTINYIKPAHDLKDGVLLLGDDLSVFSTRCSLVVEVEVEDTSKYHKHHKEIIAFAKGAKIQYKDWKGLWFSASCPSWSLDTEYRVEPEPMTLRDLEIEQIESKIRELADDLAKLKETK